MFLRHIEFCRADCCSNVAEALVSKGLATVVRYRQGDDQRSSCYDDLLKAEDRAEKKAVGVHSKKESPLVRVADISGVCHQVHIWCHINPSLLDLWCSFNALTLLVELQDDRVAYTSPTAATRKGFQRQYCECGCDHGKLTVNKSNGSLPLAYARDGWARGRIGPLRFPAGCCKRPIKLRLVCFVFLSCALVCYGIFVFHQMSAVCCVWH